MCDGIECPVAFASRTLSKAETNYGQIEKEALALVYGVKKFHRYLYGRQFTMVTDHKPLLSILNAKSAVPSIAAARMQRWAIFLSAYQYDIEYKSSKANANADCLSRLPIQGDTELEDPVTVFQISHVDDLPVTVAQAISKDPVLVKVYQYVMEGWPHKPVEENIKPFYQRKDQLSADQGCLLWGLRTIMQARMLKELHSAHAGMVKMKAVARSIIWWPRMDQEIEETVSKCDSCAEHRNLPPQAPLHSWPWASHSMQRIHIDFASIDQFQVLVIIDAHSKWIDATPLRSATTRTTIEVLRRFFANFGLPEELVSDNGPQFTSQEFRKFCSNNGIQHCLIPPYHPASNGAAERAVQVVKQAMKKMGNQLPLAQRLARFLLAYRTTPHTTTEMRPDELFLHRKLRTRLTLIKPNLFTTVQKHQLQQKQAHNNKKALAVFKEGTRVLVRNHRGIPKWLNGKILKQKRPVSYLVRVGSSIRHWHVDHLIKRKATSEDKSDRASSVNRDSTTDFTCMPDDEIVVTMQPQNVSEGTQSSNASEMAEPSQLRRSARHVQPPQRLIEEM